jgi:ADP-ribose pyrophosphatase
MRTPEEPARLVSRRRVFEGRVVTVDVDEIVQPDGVACIREVIRHGGSVAVLPVRPGGRIVLVRQYRHSARRSVWELCAGLLEPDEGPEDAARRELEEETGLAGGTLEPLASFHASPGYSEEFIHLFRATDQVLGPSRPDGEERIEVREFPLDEARQMAADGRIHDAKTLLALVLESERHRREVQP